MTFRLTVLPETIRIDCGAYAEDDTPDVHPFAGLTAIVKPLDIETWADWSDAFPSEDQRRKAATVLAKQQLVGIEGVTPEQGGPYDHAKHFRGLPLTLVLYIYAQLVQRATLTGVQEKNSGSPSGSDGTNNGAA